MATASAILASNKPAVLPEKRNRAPASQSVLDRYIKQVSLQIGWAVDLFLPNLGSGRLVGIEWVGAQTGILELIKYQINTKHTNKT
jgi:hypothetical protein